MKVYGLIGYPLSHSFSQGYFSDKFDRLGLMDHMYLEFPIRRIQDFPGIIETYPGLKGLNVTIPYKEQVIPYLHALSPEAEAIGAANVIKVEDKKLIGHNTDWLGFQKSLEPLLRVHFGGEMPAALVLGTGGASKAVVFTLNMLGIALTQVSRKPKPGCITYDELDPELITRSQLIVQTTPLGMFPDVHAVPDLDFDAIGKAHLLFDLIYNPEKTEFLRRGEMHGARIQNGMEMLRFQAEVAWAFWQKD